MREKMNKFCNSKFWDANVTWYTDVPDFTQCFQDVVFVIIPCVCFWIVYLFHLLRISQRDSVLKPPWSLISCTKLVLSVCLLCLSAIEGYFMWSHNSLKEDLLVISICCVSSKIITFVIVTCTLNQHHCYRIKSSSMLCYFWFVFSVCGIVMYRSTFLKIFYENFPFVTKEKFIIDMLYYPLVFGQFFLSLFSDTSGSDKLEEECSLDVQPFFTFFTFHWFDKLIYKNANKLLEVTDFPPLSFRLKSAYLWMKFKEKWIPDKNKMISEKVCDSYVEVLQPSCTSLVLTSIKAFWPWILTACFFELIYNVVRFIPPLILDLIIQYVSSDSYAWKGFIFCIALFITSFLSKFLCNAFIFYSNLTALQVKSALSSAVYRKVLKISCATKRKYTTGEIVNLVAIDINKIFHFLLFFTGLFGAPLRIFITIALLWVYLGPSCLAGAAVISLMVPLSALIARRNHTVQRKQMEFKDSRLKHMNEILNGIKVLKLWAWEVPFMEKISSIRKIEVSLIRTFQLCYSGFSFVWGCAPFLVAVASFVTYVLVDENNILTPSVAFVSLNLLNMLRYSLFDIPDLISNIVQINISLRRLKAFLTSEEYDLDALGNMPDEGEAITIQDAHFTWDAESGDAFLKNINLHVTQGALIAIIGPVGAGKSSLLSAILGDIKKVSGSVQVQGNIAYVPQQAWIQNQTLRQNILFVKPMDRSRYDETLNNCCLRPDLRILPGGDHTEIGEKGVNLSGGQKHRISLARAVYQDADIYLLDDPLSAVDAHVGKQLFENVIGNTGMLKCKTRVLVTHNLSFLSDVDLIITMKDGKVEEMGTYKDLLNRDSYFSEFIQKENFKESTEMLADEIELESPVVSKSDPMEFFKLESFIEMSNINSSSPVLRSISVDSVRNEAQFNLIEEEKIEVGKVKLAVYINYLKNAGLHILLPAVIGYIGYQAFDLGSNFWLREWSSDPITSDSILDASIRNKRISVYASLGLCQAAFLVFGTVLLAFGSARASRRYHEQMLNSVMKSPLSFFDTTPLGRIVNRFGKDIDTIDTQISLDLDGWLACFFSAIGTFIIIGMSTPLFLAILIPIGAVYYLMQKFYLNTSRQIKRLDSVTRSPVFIHFSETIQGVSSIKAYKVEEHFIKTSELRVDTNISCYYHWTSCNRWLAFRLDLLGVIIILSASLLEVNSKGILDAATVGLSLTYALSVTDALTWLIRTGTELENESVSIERIDEYSSLPSEAPWYIDDSHLPETWPCAGSVSFENYSTQYRKDLDLVLKNINLNIKPSEKVGIVGRTGAGKSSITLALFRIIEPTEGTIIIDGIDVTQIGLHKLRSNLTIIPQDPVLFTGSLRTNLDPNNNYSDEEIWISLEHAHLKKFVSSLESGLNYDIAEGGENLSVGQRQLLCLARALLKKTKILVLDEATAAVDMVTDKLIQNTIRTNFANCTVITIAHRLHTILDYDKVIVMDSGEIVEVGNPTELLQKPNSRFYCMAKDTGLI